MRFRCAGIFMSANLKDITVQKFRPQASVRAKFPARFTESDFVEMRCSTSLEQRFSSFFQNGGTTAMMQAQRRAGA